MILKKSLGLFEEFFNSEKASGVILIGCTIFSLMIANSFMGPDYTSFWKTTVGFSVGGWELKKDIAYWVNELFMAVFFLLVGLEIEREIYTGELSEGRKAVLPVMAALGGMIVPGAIYYFLNAGKESASGFGIPMATDIAFALGVLAMLGNRVPLALKVFLAALAIIDDLGAILLIAIFYVKGFHFDYFMVAVSIIIFLVILNRSKVYSLFPYLVFGIFLWYFLLKSGVHATITGVILAFVIPFKKGLKNSPSDKLMHYLHKPVAFFILPVFALANTGIIIKSSFLPAITEPHITGAFFGLVIGKPAGIILFSYLALKFGMAKLSDDMTFKNITGAGFLAGIGFTMAIFISLLAFENSYLINTSKMAVLAASVVSGFIGWFVLRKTLK